jgi:P4 family phage/plasmid primase-like protien
VSDQQVEKLVVFAKENGISAPAALVAGALPDTPAAWFSAKFPGLEKAYGRAVQEAFPPDDKPDDLPWVKDVSEDFLAATLGEVGTPDAPTVFVAAENRFYTYCPFDGIFREVRDDDLSTNLSDLLLECARACSTNFDTRSLEFKFRDSSNLRGVLARARGVLQVEPSFFESGLTKFLPCKNGMLRISDRELLEFSPSYRRRNKLDVPYFAGAKCPLFLATLLEPALSPEAIELLQRCCGLALIGVNLAQKITILTGTPGGGKGTVVRVIVGIIGATNVGTLRPDLLAERFELGRLLGKSLLYGADVPENFLNCKGASVLKSLTGGDPVTLEFKGSNERPEIICRFNVIATCNSRLTVRLEGDADAWRRRLVIIEFLKPKTETVIADLSERILAQEAPGVLNWMLEGLDKIAADGWQLRLTQSQQKVVDELLLESEGEVVFAKECLERSASDPLTIADCYERYVRFCTERGWGAMAKKKFSNAICDTIARLFGVTVRHDVCDQSGKRQRGWKGIKCL